MHRCKRRPETPLNYIYEYMNRELSMEDGTFINMYSYSLFLNINTLSSSKNIRTYFAFRLYSD